MRCAYVLHTPRKAMLFLPFDIDPAAVLLALQQKIVAEMLPLQHNETYMIVFKVHRKKLFGVVSKSCLMDLNVLMLV